MNIFDKHGNPVGELERPEPMERDGEWYEPVSYRCPMQGELCIAGKDLLIFVEYDQQFPAWIMRPIPRATPDQLAAIGMRERDSRPVEVKDGDKTVVIFNSTAIKLWQESCELDIGKSRWVLVPVVKESAHTSCVGCVEFYQSCDVVACITRLTGERKNYTPAPTPAPDVTLIGDLLPCPFCGSIELSCNGHFVECDICGAKGPSLHPVPEGNTAKKMWNSRKPAPAPTHMSCEGCVVKNYESPICAKGVRCDCYTNAPAPALKVSDELMTEHEAYMQLIYAVVLKYPSESRHDTALRYIRQAEGMIPAPALKVHGI